MTCRIDTLPVGVGNSVMEEADHDHDHESGWPDLPSDLLGLVLGRLPSLADRVRLGAVCRRIRSTITLLPPLPHLPWIVLQDGTLFDLSSNVPVYQVPLPDTDDASCYSAGEGTLFLMHRDGWCSLLNALSGDTTDLPELSAVLRRYNVREDNVFKVIMSKSSTSHGPIVAVLCRCGIIVSTCRPAGKTNSCLKAVIMTRIHDIVFFQGSLYAICGHRLFAFDLRFHKPTPPGHKPDYIGGNVICGQGLASILVYARGREQYLVESNGKLLLAAMLRTEGENSQDDDGMQETMKSTLFEVWEADMSNHQWKEVDGGLDGRALLVSLACSKSVPSATVDGLHGDCVYFIHHRHNGPMTLGSGVYNMRTKTSMPLPHALTPLLRELTPLADWGRIAHMRYGYKPNRQFPAWFFPNNATPTECGTCGKEELEPKEAVDAKPWRTCTTLFCLPYWMSKWDHVD